MTVKRSLRDKVAQLFTLSALGPELDETTRRMVTELKVGGMFLGTSCLQNPEQVYKLTAALQKASIEEGSGQPLFISADLVAGAGCKLKKGGAVHFPKNRAIGAAGDEELAYEAGRITAEESLAMGVNFNYSPVLDINNNPLNPVIGTHSFGEDRDTVDRLGNAVIRGYQENGLIATAKHFPGHGDTSVDSHYDLPVLPFDKERLDRFELVPFRSAIANGVDAIMVAHVSVPELDPSGLPASLSYELTTRLLREELGFEGLIVTDGLTMKGVTNRFTLEEACVMALQAGADILLGTTDSYDQAAAMLDTVVRAVEDGRLPESRIDESLARLEAARQKYKLTTTDFASKPYAADSFLKESNCRIDRELARKAITPLHGITEAILVEEAAPTVLIYDARCAIFAGKLADKLSVTQVNGASIPTVAVSGGFEELLRAVLALDPASARPVIATAGTKPMGPELAARLSERLKSFQQAVWVHFGSEYDVRNASVPTLLLYDFAPSLQEAAAEYFMS